MVTNSFGNRNFMQPMEGSACTQRALIFFLLGFGFWGEGGDGFFSFFLCSQHVPFKFPLGSHKVLNMFPRFPMCSPRVFPIAPPFNPICFAHSPPLLTYIGGGQNVRQFILPLNLLYLGSFHNFNFFCNVPIKLAHCKKRKKVGLVRHPQLIKMKQNKYPQSLFLNQVVFPFHRNIQLEVYFSTILNFRHFCLSFGHFCKSWFIIWIRTRFIK